MAGKTSQWLNCVDGCSGRFCNGTLHESLHQTPGPVSALTLKVISLVELDHAYCYNHNAYQGMLIGLWHQKIAAWEQCKVCCVLACDSLVEGYVCNSWCSQTVVI